ncbi:major facilitator superfamily transporter [Xylariomycetidae sp. FL2044]|nr:major facilitator superfamily transporter [Xylariomycetidae sp. FL2044]
MAATTTTATTTKPTTETTTATAEATMANDETTPLLGLQDPAPKKGTWFSDSARLLTAAFIISLSFNYTQTPIIYSFHIMACEEFYRHAPAYAGDGDRCSRNEIDSAAAAQLAILGCVTVFVAIGNLFVAGWQMRKVGPKLALAIQVFFPVIRVCIQAGSLAVGAREGMIMMQLSQLTNLSGGPGGYFMVLNTIVAVVTEPAARTEMFGRLQGANMMGTALGYFIGGFVGEKFGIKAPFELAAVSLFVCCVYTAFFCPYIDPEKVRSDQDTKGKGLSSYLGPLKSLGPQKMRREDGRLFKHYGITFLAIGIFTGVLATAYAPTLIQMYAMNEFNFASTQNSLLMSVLALVRGLFLMFIFPSIIKYGRKWYQTSNQAAPTEDDDPASAIPTQPRDFDPSVILDPEQEPPKPPPPAEKVEGAGFDLFFLRWSLLVDGVVTASAAFMAEWWQIYLLAFLLPLASGSAPASKGVLTEMVAPTKKADAIQAMTLVEFTATFLTLGLFGFIFSTLADVGKSYLTFYCNAAVAIVGIGILLLSSFPPDGAGLVNESEEDDHLQASETNGNGEARENGEA